MYNKHLYLAAVFSCGLRAFFAAGQPAAAHFHDKVKPLLDQYCGDCHEDGANKGNVAFDQFKSDTALLSSNALWFAVLKNVRAGLMPPAGKPRPGADDIKRLETWIKYDAFGINAAHPDPGRVTLRRLNRFEYRNTVRNLLGVDYDTEGEFPADDTGYGFDDIGDVLTLPPMLLEKYVNASKTIIGQAVPVAPLVMPETIIPGYKFRRAETNLSEEAAENPASLSYHESGTLTNHWIAEHDGNYVVVLDLTAHEHFVDGGFDYNKCRLIFTVDGREMFRHDYVREAGRAFHYEFPLEWKAGEHEFSLAVQPLTPEADQLRDLRLHLDSLTIRGPADKQFWIHPPNYARFFPREVPESTAARRAFAREILQKFADRAFRRPADSNTVDRLVALAEGQYSQPGKTFEFGVAQAMIAALASPQFLFREEGVEQPRAFGSFCLIDEYALASRLSYFLWSSMPDDELIQLAARHELRANLAREVKRMVADPKSDALVKNFTGQWLQARDIETVPIDARAVVDRDKSPDSESQHVKTRFWELNSIHEKRRTSEESAELEKLRPIYLELIAEPRTVLSGELRKDMRSEVEMYFSGILHEDRNVTELVDSDYTYLNGKLAKHYGLTNLDVRGPELRRVTLPPDCPRGGVLTMGAVLAVTSNPTRTSPVKRGLFILDNVLGNPTPPPPPNIPALEESEKGLANKGATLRDVLAIHRSKPMCNSCHSRMDPMGLAMENFNALGLWRAQERGVPIDASGKLATGENFNGPRELKHLLAANHRVEFYRTLTGKLLTYALGRGLEYSDVETVDQIVDRLEQNDGRFSALLSGIIDSSPFQMRRESAKLADNRSPGQK